MTGGSPTPRGAAVCPHAAGPASSLALALLLSAAALAGCSGDTPEARERPGDASAATPVVVVQPERATLDDVFLEREAP